MSTKHFCDDCDKEFQIQYKVQVRFYVPRFIDFEMCYTCFNKHWKPIKKKFFLENQYANKI